MESKAFVESGSNEMENHSAISKVSSFNFPQEANYKLINNCKYCSKPIFGKSNFIKHMSLHTAGKKKKKKNSFAGGKISENRRKLHSTVTRFCCKFCNRQFLTKQNLRLHHTLRHNVDKSTISFDGISKTGKVTTDVEKNIRPDDQGFRGFTYVPTLEQTSGKIYHCTHCSKYIIGRSKFVKHLLSHTAKPFCCHVCFISFSTNGRLSRHLRKLHDVKNNYFLDRFCKTSMDDTLHSMSEARKNNEHLSSSASSTSETEILKSQDIQVEENSQYSDESFEESLKKKCLSNLPKLCIAKLSEHQCKFCGLIVLSKRAFTKHLKCHSTKPYRCHICMSSKAHFSTEQDLDSHLNIHHGFRRHQFLVETDQTSRDRQTNDVLKEKYAGNRTNWVVRNSYLCAYCPATIVGKVKFTRHLKSHTPKPFHCHLCPLQFSIGATLSKHLIERHGHNPLIDYFEKFLKRAEQSETIDGQCESEADMNNVENNVPFDVADSDSRNISIQEGSSLNEENDVADSDSRNVSIQEGSSLNEENDVADSDSRNISIQEGSSLNEENDVADSDSRNVSIQEGSSLNEENDVADSHLSSSEILHSSDDNITVLKSSTSQEIQKDSPESPYEENRNELFDASTENDDSNNSVPDAISPMQITDIKFNFDSQNSELYAASNEEKRGTHFDIIDPSLTKNVKAQRDYGGIEPQSDGVPFPNVVQVAENASSLQDYEKNRGLESNNVPVASRIKAHLQRLRKTYHCSRCSKTVIGLGPFTMHQNWHKRKEDESANRELSKAKKQRSNKQSGKNDPSSQLSNISTFRKGLGRKKKRGRAIHHCLDCGKIIAGIGPFMRHRKAAHSQMRMNPLAFNANTCNEVAGGISWIQVKSDLEVKSFNLKTDAADYESYSNYGNDVFTIQEERNSSSSTNAENHIKSLTDVSNDGHSEGKSENIHDVQSGIKVQVRHPHPSSDDLPSIRMKTEIEAEAASEMDHDANSTCNASNIDITTLNCNSDNWECNLRIHQIKSEYVDLPEETSHFETDYALACNVSDYIPHVDMKTEGEIDIKPLAENNLTSDYNCADPGEDSSHLDINRSVKREYRCRFCFENMVDKMVYIQHMKRHKRGAMAGNVHANKNIQLSVFSCNYCGDNVKGKVRFTNHLKGHTKGKPFLCHICLNSFTSPPSLTYHLNKKHSLRIIQSKHVGTQTVAGNGLSNSKSPRETRESAGSNRIHEQISPRRRLENKPNDSIDEPRHGEDIIETSTRKTSRSNDGATPFDNLIPGQSLSTVEIALSVRLENNRSINTNMNKNHRRYRCKYCRRTIIGIGPFTHHLQAHRRCKFCSKVFPSETILKRHVKFRHTIQNRRKSLNGSPKTKSPRETREENGSAGSSRPHGKFSLGTFENTPNIFNEGSGDGEHTGETSNINDADLLVQHLTDNSESGEKMLEQNNENADTVDLENVPLSNRIRYRCTYCRRTMIGIGPFTHHLQAHRRCKFCSKVFPSETILKRHVKFRHSTQNRRESLNGSPKTNSAKETREENGSAGSSRAQGKFSLGTFENTPNIFNEGSGDGETSNINDADSLVQHSTDNSISGEKILEQNHENADTVDLENVPLSNIKFGHSINPEIKRPINKRCARYRCGICRKTVRGAGPLAKHMKTHRRGCEDSKQKEELESTSQCDGVERNVHCEDNSHGDRDTSDLNPHFEQTLGQVGNVKLENASLWKIKVVHSVNHENNRSILNKRLTRYQCMHCQKIVKGIGPITTHLRAHRRQRSKFFCKTSLLTLKRRVKFAHGTNATEDSSNIEIPQPVDIQNSRPMNSKIDKRCISYRCRYCQKTVKGMGPFATHLRVHGRRKIRKESAASEIILKEHFKQGNREGDDREQLAEVEKQLTSNSQCENDVEGNVSCQDKINGNLDDSMPEEIVYDDNQSLGKVGAVEVGKAFSLFNIEMAKELKSNSQSENDAYENESFHDGINCNNEHDLSGKNALHGAMEPKANSTRHVIEDNLTEDESLVQANISRLESFSSATILTDSNDSPGLDVASEGHISTHHDSTSFAIRRQKFDSQMATRKFQCHECWIAFDDVMKLREHLRDHNVVKIGRKKGRRCYSCQYCPKTFQVLVNFVAHLSKHIGKFIYRCCFCNKEFMQKFQLNVHLRNLHDIVITNAKYRQHESELLKNHLSLSSTFQCFECWTTFENGTTLREHLLDPNNCVKVGPGESRYKCRYCQRKFEFENNVVAHITSDHSKFPYHCSFCEKNFERKGELNLHLRHHGIDLVNTSCEDPNDKIIFKSNYVTREVESREGRVDRSFLDSKDQSDEQQLESDRNNSESISSQFCETTPDADQYARDEEPGKGLDISLLDSTDHSNGNVSGIIPSLKDPSSNHLGKFQCYECWTTFDDSTTLKQHLRGHEKSIRKTGPKKLRFSCQYCRKAMISKSERYIIAHLSEHIGKFFYRCSFCQKKYESKRHLYWHLRRHGIDMYAPPSKGTMFKSNYAGESVVVPKKKCADLLIQRSKDHNDKFDVGEINLSNVSCQGNISRDDEEVYVGAREVGEETDLHGEINPTANSTQHEILEDNPIISEDINEDKLLVRAEILQLETISSATTLNNDLNKPQGFYIASNAENSSNVTSSENYECNDCTFQIDSKIKLIEHTSPRNVPPSYTILHQKYQECELILGEFQCYECWSIFDDEVKLREHLVDHKTRGSSKHRFSCLYCEMTFEFQKYFVAHLSQHVGKLVYRCRFCDEKCRKEGNIHFHVHRSIVMPGMLNRPQRDNGIESLLESNSNLSGEIISSSKDHDCSINRAIVEPENNCAGHHSNDQNNQTQSELSFNAINGSSQGDIKIDVELDVRDANNPIAKIIVEQPNHMDDKALIQAEILRPSTETFTDHSSKSHGFEVADAEDSSHITSSKNIYECNDCNFKIGDKIKLTEHITTHNVSPLNAIPHPKYQDKTLSNFQCYECWSAFDDKMKLKEHLVDHKKSGWRKHLFNCPYCEKTFEFEKYLVAHLAQHLGEQVFSCAFCGKKFRQKGGLNVHLHIRHGIVIPSSRDQKQQKNKCDQRSEVEAVVKSNHGETKAAPRKCRVPRSFPDLVGPNDDCEGRIAASKIHDDIIDLHRRECICYECWNTFENSTMLRKHLRKHEKAHRKRGPRKCKLFSCPYCTRTMRNKPEKGIIAHISKHIPNFLYHCSFCENKFRQKKTLYIHLYQHGICLYQRDVKNQNNEQNPKDHICNACGKRYKSKGALLLHLKYHTGDFIFKCKICLKDFVDRSRLHWHLKQVHKKVIFSHRRGRKI